MVPTIGCKSLLVTKPKHNLGKWNDWISRNSRKKDLRAEKSQKPTNHIIEHHITSKGNDQPFKLKGDQPEIKVNIKINFIIPSFF